ncbi:MAG: hypothetical protein M3R70_05620 [Actinomycetota bacterium]|nr:hypothetical protein [Actinomycetota bacterium]
MTNRHPQATLIAAVITVALAAALMVFPGHAVLALDAYVLALGAIALAALVRRTRQLEERPASPIDRPLPALPTGTERLPELDRFERIVALSCDSAFDLHYRLRPLLRELVSARLAGHGIELDRMPDAARTATGEDLWELVRPDRELGNRSDPGLPLADTRSLVDAVEAIQ